MNYSEAYGTWVNDAFCLPGWQDGSMQPLYFATAAFTSVQPDWIAEPDPKPDPKADPINPETPNTPNQSDSSQGKSYSAKTGDNTQLLSALLVAISLSSALVLARASVQFATRKK